MASRSLFAIALSQESAPAWQALRERWPEQRCIASGRLAYARALGVRDGHALREGLCALGHLASDYRASLAVGGAPEVAGP